MSKQRRVEGEAKTRTTTAASLAPVIERNIRTLIEQRQAQERKLSWQERLGLRIGFFAGSISFVIIHLIAVISWVAINVGWIPWIKPFDPTFVILAGVASVEAIFLSAFILITQNRMMEQADRRADLNLQISLLAEYEITRLMEITREIAKRMDIKEAEEPELEHLVQDVAPEDVLATIDHLEQRLEKETRS